MAIPMNRFTVAVANFCDSGAVQQPASADGYELTR
jgi:hypothetical protein